MHLAATPPRSKSGPTTAAAPGALLRGSSPASFEVAEHLAEELEGLRRQVTWGGGLLLIPATMAFVVGLAGAAGVGGIWLALCALIGLSAGPGVCCAALALSHLFGLPGVRALYHRRARQLGVGSATAERAWQLACERLDDAERRRWTSPERRPEALASSTEA